VTESSEVLPVAIALLSEHLHECIVTLMNMSRGGALHTSASVPVLVLIPAAGFNSQGCAGFNSGLLELKPAQPSG
jgi:hypothetical protein